MVRAELLRPLVCECPSALWIAVLRQGAPNVSPALKPLSVTSWAEFKEYVTSLARIMHRAERFHTFDWRPAQRRSVQLGRCEATRLATRMGLICLRRGRVGGRRAA